MGGRTTTPTAGQLLAAADECARRNDVVGAADVFTKFLKHHPRHPAAGAVQLKCGQTLVRLGRYEEGVRLIRGLVEADPSSMIARDSLVLAYHYAGRLDEALDVVEATLAIDPDHAEALARRGELLLYAGAPDEAAALLDAARARGVADWTLDLAFAGVAPRVGRAPEAIDRLRALLASGSITPPQRREVLFTLARLLEGVGEYDQAWNTIEEAHTLRAARFNPDAFDRRAAAMIERFTPQAIASVPAPVDPGDDVVLVVGSPRSGTTLVEQVLAGHPRVSTAGEMPSVELAAVSLGVWPDPGAWRPERLRRADVARASGRLLMDLRSRAGEGDRRIDKQPGNWMHVGLAAALTPGARVIQVRRDPRDTAISLYFRHFTGGHEFATRLDWIGRYLRTCARVTRHWSAMSERGDLRLGLTDVRYESLVASTEPEARRLVEFLGLTWDGACLSFHERRAITPTLTPEQAGRPVYDSSVAKWRRYEGRLAPLLEALGDEAPVGDA
ncbi:MAG: sulfotransferase [Phycisphaerales bacterium]